MKIFININKNKNIKRKLILKKFILNDEIII